MTASNVFAPAAILAAVAAGAPRPDPDGGAPADDSDVSGMPDVDELRMLRVERTAADRELDAICELIDASSIEDLPDDCVQALPEVPVELVLCLAPDEVLFEGMAI